MDYVDLSGDLTSTESTTLDGLATGAVPVKTTTGFIAATQDNIPAGATYKPYNPAAVGAMAGAALGSTCTVNGQPATAMPTSAEKTTITALQANGYFYDAAGTIPAFVANAASIAPGTDKASLYVLPAALTVAAASDLTVATTGTPLVGHYHIACLALALGFSVTVVNGGAAGGNLGSGFAASYTRARVMHLYFDGTNFIFNGYEFIGAA